MCKKCHSENLNRQPTEDVVRVSPQSLRLQAQLQLASLDSCRKWGECADSCARGSVCFCSRSGGGASIIVDPYMQPGHSPGTR